MFSSDSIRKGTLYPLGRSMSNMIIVHLKFNLEMSSEPLGKIHVKSNHFQLWLKRKMSSTAPSQICTKSVHFVKKIQVEKRAVELKAKSLSDMILPQLSFSWKMTHRIRSQIHTKHIIIFASEIQLESALYSPESHARSISSTISS